MENCINESDLCQLKELLRLVARTLDSTHSARDIAALTRQYRELLKEIREAEREEEPNEIDEIVKASGAAKMKHTFDS